jgi:hypothetical protein
VSIRVGGEHSTTHAGLTTSELGGTAVEIGSNVTLPHATGSIRTSVTLDVSALGDYRGLDTEDPEAIRQAVIKRVCLGAFGLAIGYLAHLALTAA